MSITDLSHIVTVLNFLRELYELSSLKISVHVFSVNLWIQKLKCSTIAVDDYRLSHPNCLLNCLNFKHRKGLIVLAFTQFCEYLLSLP